MKTVEEIRMTRTSMNQRDFAKAIGTTIRSYTNKVAGLFEWKLSELVKIAEFNDGQVKVTVNSKDYTVTIKED